MAQEYLQIWPAVWSRLGRITLELLGAMVSPVSNLLFGVAMAQDYRARFWPAVWSRLGLITLKRLRANNWNPALNFFCLEV